MSRVFEALERVEGAQGRGASGVLDRPAGEAASGRRDPADFGDYERLASTILQARSAAPFKTMMVAAPEHGEGASTVAAGLAQALADHARVLLVDANFRSPALTGMLHAEPSPGLADALAGRVEATAAIAETGVANVRFVAAGAGADDAARLLLTHRFSAVMRELADASDIVIVDVPPVLPYADALTVASKVERVVLVTCAERTQRDHLERAKDELEKSGAVILGVVLNRKPSHAPPWIQRYLNL